MTTAPKRRWFAYSLRTLFVVVTVFGVWLGYELNWIRERHEFLAQEKLRQEAAWPVAMRDRNVNWWRNQMESSDHAAPGLLWIFGEQPVGDLLVTIPTRDIKVSLRQDGNIEFTHREILRSQPDFQQAKRLFPEATIMPMRWDEHIPPASARAFTIIAVSP